MYHIKLYFINLRIVLKVDILDNIAFFKKISATMYSKPPSQTNCILIYSASKDFLFTQEILHRSKTFNAWHKRFMNAYQSIAGTWGGISIIFPLFTPPYLPRFILHLFEYNSEQIEGERAPFVS